ncbi:MULTISPECIES: endolytic transglycosylase MltG [unclassified Paenibacillus]|uniref:endolytic transglycosylase MltG n=1 Tax=unclassified Paenibacillus TaxID=185978 RepID=UPI0009316488|nr:MULTISPECIES: endolytic transglycosylase MltG [unclassified Paenibacillus]
MTRKRVWISGLLLIICLAAGLTVGVALYISRALSPTLPSDTPVRVALPAGTGVGELAHELQRKGLVRDARLFTYYVKYKGEGGRFQAGEYDMQPGLTPDEIIAKLNRGETAKEAGLRLTVPEGFTFRQIAEKLQQSGMDPAAFEAAAAKFVAPAGSAAAGIPANPNLKARLEGYLYPDTYEWKKDASPDELIATMTAQLDKRLQELPQGWRQAMEARGLTLHQTLTVASLIEREVAIPEERALVSGVIHNRLKQNKQLEIDATIQYLFDKQKERLYEKDLQVDSPYNTYLNRGLPPGPIASPSIASIQAAIYPQETTYLFYVTKKDGSRKHLFAETFEEHKKNIAESNKTAAP